MASFELLAQPAVFVTAAAVFGLAIASFGSGVTCNAG
jgi:hypothetical protein